MKVEMQIAVNLGFVSVQILQESVPLDQAVEAFRLSLARNAVQRCGGNQCKAAKALGVHRNTLSRILNGAAVPSE